MKCNRFTYKIQQFFKNNALTFESYLFLINTNTSIFPNSLSCKQNLKNHRMLKLVMTGAARARTPTTTNYDVHSATWADGKPAHPLKCNEDHWPRPRSFLINRWPRPGKYVSTTSKPPTLYTTRPLHLLPLSDVGLIRVCAILEYQPLDF